MIIKNIELINFRIYQGNNAIDFSPVEGEGKNIYVVSGKNGFGKTTFLMSLVWCLYGNQMDKVDDLYKQEIDDKGGYTKYIVNSLNRQAKASEDYSFSVKIVITDAIIPALSCSEISIKRTYNVLTAREDLEILIDGSENELIRELSEGSTRGEDNFIRDYILPIEIAKFFFFDAEKIVSLAEFTTPEQRQNLSRAYSEILGIKKYEDTKAVYDDIQLRLRANTASPRERSKITSLNDEISDAKLNISDHNGEILKLKTKRQDLKFESDEIQQKLIRVGNLISLEELETLRRDRTALENKQNELQSELGKSYDLVPFAIAADRLSEVANQVKIESEYKKQAYERESLVDVEDKVLDDLADEVEKCGKNINGSIKDFYNQALRKLIKRYFQPSEIDFGSNFKLLHDLTESERAQMQTLLDNLRLSFREQFKRVHFEYNHTRNELNSIRRRIADAESLAEDALIKADRERKAGLDNEIDRIGEQIGGLEQANSSLALLIVQKEKQLEELRKKLTASAQDKRKDQLAEVLAQRVREYIALYKERKKDLLAKEVKRGLKLLMHKRGFVHDVKVHIIGDLIEIDLYNKRGEVIAKEGLSKGEQQLYATALLYGLVEESDVDFPVFIDSPMQKFDDQHAENIVRQFYPSIAKQVILFPLINKELSANEYDILLPHVARAYLIVNHDADKSGFEPVAPSQLFARYAALYQSPN